MPVLVSHRYLQRRSWRQPAGIRDHLRQLNSNVIVKARRGNRPLSHSIRTSNTIRAASCGEPVLGSYNGLNISQSTITGNSQRFDHASAPIDANPSLAGFLCRRFQRDQSTMRAMARVYGWILVSSKPVTATPSQPEHRWEPANNLFKRDHGAMALWSRTLFRSLISTAIDELGQPQIIGMELEPVRATAATHEHCGYRGLSNTIIRATVQGSRAVYLSVPRERSSATRVCRDQHHGNAVRFQRQRQPHRRAAPCKAVCGLGHRLETGTSVLRLTSNTIRRSWGLFIAP